MRRFVGFLLLASISYAGDKQKHDLRAPVRVLGPRFLVETNTFPEIAHDLERTLHHSYSLFEDRFGPLKGRARRPMRIRLYRTREEYMRAGEGVKGALGHFDPSREACAVVWSGATGEAGWPIAVHEASHNYLNRRFGRIALPSWYAEGIACWFEGLQDPTTTNRVSRLRYASAKAALRAGQAKLDLVLDTRTLVQRGKLRVSGLTAVRYYGLAWSLVHFLATDKRYSRGFRRFEMRMFAADADRGPDRRAAIKLAREILKEECGKPGKMERDWRDHISRLVPPPALLPAPAYAFELESDKAFVRYSALRRVRQNPFPERLEAGIFACLRDDDVTIRLEATRIMQRDPRSDGVYALLDSLDWGDPELRANAFRALSHPSMERAVPRLLKERLDRDEALLALASIGDARSFPELREAVLDETLPLVTRLRSMRTLVRDPGATRTFERARTDPEGAIRRTAKWAMLRSGQSTPHSEIEATLLDESDSRLLGTNAEDLARIAIDPSEDLDLRVKACTRLAEEKAEEATDNLRRLCRPGMPARLRLEAVRALIEITGERRGFEAGQGARQREVVFKRWSSD